LSVHGGTFSPIKAWNGSGGTRLEVRHLFFNTPVRRKFLRTPATELGHISEAFTRLALSHPSIHWTLRHNGKGLYEVPASASLEERICLFFGQEVRDHLYEVDSRQGPVRLTGFIADPACERGNPRMQYLFINGRWVRDRSLSHALQEAFRGLLMTGRFAVCFLFLDLPPDQVDVNVHPTKAEVRFRDGHLVYHLLFGSIRDRLRAENLVPRLQVPSSLAVPQPSPTGMGNTFWAKPPEALPVHYSRPPENETPLTSGGPPPVPYVPVSPNGAVSNQKEHLPPPGSFKAIQLYDSFLVLETPEGMLVIDQHALHERILFEQLTQRLRAGPLETQRLLIPQPVDLTADQVPRVLESREGLAELGLGVEPFGGNTVLVTSYPTILEGSPPGQILKVIVDYLVARDRVPNREVLLNDLLSLMACHSAVRAGDRLTPEQMAALLAQRELANDPHHCPHGRPTALLFSRQDLERQFRRV
jgi:DNA mismatch repair protein MutL